VGEGRREVISRKTGYEDFRPRSMYANQWWAPIETLKICPIWAGCSLSIEVSKDGSACLSLRYSWSAFLSLADTILFQLNSARAQAKDMRTPLGMVSHKGDTFMLFQLVGRRG